MINIQYLQVEICYATCNLQINIPLYVIKNTTIQQAILQSGIISQYPIIDLTVHRVGIYGKLKSLSTILHQYDRIEIYRPLIIDPKDRRRRNIINKTKK